MCSYTNHLSPARKSTALERYCVQISTLARKNQDNNLRHNTLFRHEDHCLLLRSRFSKMVHFWYILSVLRDFVSIAEEEVSYQSP